jgi:hypothetical protein
VATREVAGIDAREPGPTVAAPLLRESLGLRFFVWRPKSYDAVYEQAVPDRWSGSSNLLGVSL